MVYVEVTHFDAAATHAVIRDVRCEKCGCAYHYELIRRGEGLASAIYWIASESARRRAAGRAQALLDEYLAKGIDPVACPDCGWFQAAMVREFQGRHYVWLAMAGTVIRWMAGAILIILAADLVSDLMLRPGKTTSVGFWVAVVIFAVWFMVGVAVPWKICPMLRRRIDLNANFPEMPRPIPGMPRAFRPGEDATGGNFDAVQRPVAETAGGSTVEYARPHPLSPGGWVCVQLRSARFPGMCCSCLRQTEATKAYQPLLGSVKPEVAVPLCHPCADRFWARKGQYTVLAALVVGAGFAVWQVSATGAGITWAGAGMGAAFGWFIAHLSLPLILRPVDLRRFSAERNTIDIRFRNSVYNTAFADENQPPV